VVTTEDFNGRYADLLSALGDAVRLLQARGERHWAVWLEHRRVRISAGDRHALEQIRAAYGGMGSLSDLVIHPLNHHDIALADVAATNDRFQELLRRIWANSTEMLRDLDRS
jgi:hypothetical protein